MPTTHQVSKEDGLVHTDRQGTTAGHRLESLTGLRFMAALVVVGFHLVLLFPSAPYGPVAHFLGQGPTGVSFFFVISGFVLTWSRRREDGAARFYRRRLARIGPSHIVTWVVIGVLLVAASVPRALGPVGGSLFLLQPWIPSSHYWNAMNVPSWSLGCEVFFYALFPFLAAGLFRLGSRSRRALLVGGVLAVLVIAAVTAPASYGTTGYWLLYFFPPTRLIEFVIGMLLALEVTGGSWPRIGLGPALAVAGAAYAAAGWAPTSYRVVAVTLVPFIMLIGAAAQRDLSGRPSLWNSPVMVRLGMWSFALYLAHFPVMVALALVEGPVHLGLAGGLANAALVLVLCLGAAAVLYRLVERPAERAFRPAEARPVSLRVATLPTERPRARSRA